MNTRKTSADHASHGGGKRNADRTSSDDLAMTSKRTRTATTGGKEPASDGPKKRATTPFWPPGGKARG